MIDEGRPPLARVDGIGNFWHGSYGTTQGYRNRAGATMPGFTPNTAAANRIAQVRADAHLVDFSLPTVTTPANEAALGMERWNKAVLHGESKHYSILSWKSFGASGWPYRCADGTVYFMRAAATFATPNVLEVRARKLDVNFTEPTAVVASLQVPYVSGVDTVNFSPNGSAAAIHSYDPLFVTDASIWDNAAPFWIVEAAVSGGSASAAPTVTLSLTCDRTSAAWVDVGDTTLVQEMEWGWSFADASGYTYLSDSARVKNIQVTAFLRGKTESGQPVMRQVWNGSKITRIGAITYAPDGTRHELRSVWTNYLVDGDITATGGTTGLYEIEESGGGSSWTAVRITPISELLPYYDQDMERVRKAELERNSGVVSAITANEQYVRRVNSAFSFTIGSFPSMQPRSVYTVGTVAQVGNGWSAGVQCVDNPAVPLKFKRVAGNVLSMTIATATWQLLGWSAAHGNGQYSYSSPLTLTGNRMPAVHPESGSLNTAIRLFF